MEDNIELNGVGDRVTAHCGDVSEIAPDLEAPDRIIMPLPGHADEFIDLAVETIAPGGTIQYYRFSDEDDLWTAPIQELEDAAERAGREITVIEQEICGHHSPYTYRVCVDARVE
jgi:tRNA G37 N-methylase Trm5